MQVADAILFISLKKGLVIKDLKDSFPKIVILPKENKRDSPDEKVQDYLVFIEAVTALIPNTELVNELVALESRWAPCRDLSRFVEKYWQDHNYYK